MAWDTNRQEGDVLTAQDWNQAVQEIKSKQSRLNVVDSLDSTSSVDVLSAKQGKVLNDRITDVNTAVENVSDKIDKLPTGIYYGQYDSEEDLEDVQVTTKGYAYISSTDPAVYYVYLYDGNSWINSGNKFVTTNLETDLSTKSQTKAPTTKVVAEGIEAIDVTLARSSEDENELTKVQKYNASANINDRTAVVADVTDEVKTLGYKVLNPNLTFAEQVIKANTIYEVKDEFDLNNSTFSIPNNAYFKFNGGRLKNGKLVGKLLSTSKEIDVSWLGIIYNDSTNYAALNNGVTLSNMLSGITNEVYLKLSSNFYITKSLDSNNEPIRNLYINGCGNTIFSYNFCGFLVNKSIKIENLKFIAADFKTGDGGAFFVKFTSTPLNESRQILIKDSYFSGRCRIISASEISDANFSEYFSCIRIQNNTFENVICTIGGNVIFYFPNTNFELLEITNNIVHNFYSIFINFGLTNDSSYVDYIENFYLKKSRRISILNNLVYNDINLKPWEYHQSAYTYIEFVGGETGDCVFDNNTISNIIANNRNTAVYAAYLSVNNLVESNNVISNIYNLTGAYNNFLKAKGGGGVRIYKNNKFINEDLSNIYDNVDFSTIKYILYDFMEPLDTFILSNNIFNIKSLYININYQLEATNLVVDSNVFDVDHMSVHYRDDALFTNKQENSISSIKNNILKVNTNQGSDEYIPSLFCIDDIKNATVSVCDNRTENSLAFIITTTVKIGKSNTIENNFSTINPSKISTTTAQQLISRDGNFEGFNMKNNYIETSTGLSSNTILHHPSELKGNLSFTLKADYPIVLIREFSVPTSNKKLLIKCYDKNKTKLILDSEVNIILDGNGSYYYTGITKDNDYLNGKATSRINLKNFIDGNYFYLQLYNNNILFNSVFYQNGVTFEISVADISSNTLNMIPEKGSTEVRPTTALTSANVGFKYFDTTLGKPIYWNGSAWIDATSDYIVDNSGTLQNRLAITSPAGQQFKLTGGTKDVYLIYGNYGWLKATNGTPIWFDDSGTLNSMYNKYNYTLLTAEPDDWNTNYNTYYKIVNGVYTLLTTAETWEADTYYKKDVNAYKGIQVKLTDTDTELLNKVVKWNGTKYINIVDNVALKAGTPTITFTTENNTTTATITSTSSGKIYYTKDGNDPTSSSTEYSSAITLADGDQVKAICIRDHMDNSAPGFVPVSTPVITFSSAGILTITCETPNAKIYYTIDGSTPTTSSTEYDSSASVTIAKGVTVNAIAVLIGRVNSKKGFEKRS